MVDASSPKVREPIAIVGIGCRFPGADNPRDFWDLLVAGGDSVRDVPTDRWDAAAFYDADLTSPGKMVTPKAGLIDSIDEFDWRAFRVPPREAKYMDPQQRLLLEVAWEALEDAGIPFEQAAGTRTGVYMAIMWSDYLGLQSRDVANLTGYSAGNSFAFGPNRISYSFDLKGPSVAIDGACAGSLASVHAACQGLWLGETDMALAGGVNLMISPDAGIMLSKAGVLSPEGRCMTLDAKADGFVRGEGAGIVVLKPLSHVAEADRVYAVIRGSAVSHNGHNEWISAASAEGQERALSEAYATAGVDPATVDYVELHGTGLPKGDPIEAGVVGKVIGTKPDRQGPCALGSVKTNIGHLDSAAGIAGLIKVALALRNRQIPPTLHLNEINPAIPLDELGLTAQRELGPWPATDRPGIAGVTAISMSGLNAHVVLEGASTDRSPTTAPDGIGATRVLPLSAPSEAALTDLARDLRDQVAADLDPSLHDLCFTAALRRSHHQARAAILFDTRQDLLDALSAFVDGTVSESVVAAETPDSDPPPDMPPADRASLGEVAVTFTRGKPVDWLGLFPTGGRCVDFPTTPWQREPVWLDWLDRGERSPVKAVARASGPTFREQLGRAPAADQRDRLRAHVRARVASVIGVHPPNLVKQQQPFFDLGMTSLSAVELVALLSHDLEEALPRTMSLEYPTVDDLTAYLADTVLSLDPGSSRSPVEADGNGHGPETLASRLEHLSDEETEALLLERLKGIQGG